MKLENLPRSKETKSIKRVGRGPGSGMGKTSTRGEKGQKARSGASIKPWFQGGQTPLHRRIPIRGFNNKNFSVRYATLNLGDLEKFFKDGDVVTPEILKERKIIKKELNGIKILAGGELTKKLTVRAHRFTTAAVTKIENAGGKAEVI